MLGKTRAEKAARNHVSVQMKHKGKVCSIVEQKRPHKVVFFFLLFACFLRDFHGYLIP